MNTQLTHLVIVIKGKAINVRLIALDRGYALQDLNGKIHLKAPTLHHLMARI